MALFFPRSSSPSGMQTSSVHLLPELYGRIFDFVDNRADLLSLCHVSRLFHHEAERVLYGFVHLSNNPLLIKDWFQKMANDSRLAALVHTLTFGIVHALVPIPAYTWLAIIERGLSALINLKEWVPFSRSCIR
jgi:hypothetical protein